MGNEFGDSIGIIGGAEAGAVGILGAFALVYGLVMLFAFAYSIVTYVLHSLGLYTIARRRRISNPWLAWIPVGNLWLLGCISDQYQHMAKGKVTGRRKILLGLSIAAIAIYFLWIFSLILGMVFVENAGTAMAGYALLMMLGAFVLFGIAIALTVYQYMCYYDLYHSCDPNNSVLFLVLSIVFSGIMPFFVFACRNKDNGMPRPKQPAPVAEIPVEETVAEGEPVNE